VTISPYLMPLSILERVAAMPGRPPLVGWVGDRFGAEVRAIASLHDALAYSDTGLLALHQSFGFPARAAYLPYAANPRLDLGVPSPQERRPDLVFVASPTALRREIVERISTPITLYGEGWRASGSVAHRIDSRWIGVEELARIYRSHLAVLNIRNEVNVLGGLNQRHFDPYLAATPVLSDAQPDIERCFEPEREMLVYENGDELNETYARLKREPGFALAVGEWGRQRVLADHTYGHRLAALVRLGGG
jgi:spore maturation protein CgeB